MSGDLPTIVDGSKIKTEVRRGGIFIHRYTVRNGETKSQKEYWRTEKRLGGGAYGTVYLQKRFKGACKGPGVRALKIIPQDERARERINWVRELETIMEFSHPACEEYFVSSLGWFDDNMNTYIAMEYLEHGDLGGYLRERQILSEPETKDISFQLVCGLRYMHGKNFAHRDLKPGNIMIKTGPPNWWVKIGDFGLSKRIEETLGISSTIKGTPAFMAPEVLDAASQNKKLLDAKPVDMWSLGEIIFRVLAGRPVFDTGRAIWDYADEKKELPLDILESKRCTPEAIHIFTGLMARKPSDRLTAENCYSHRWLAGSRVASSPVLSSTDSEIPEVESLHIHELSLAQGTWDFDEDAVPSGEWTQPSIAPPNYQSRDTESTLVEGTAPQSTPPEPLALIAVEKGRRRISAYKRHLWTPENKPSEKFTEILTNGHYPSARNSPSPFQSDSSDEAGIPLAVLASGELPAKEYRPYRHKIVCFTDSEDEGKDYAPNAGNKPAEQPAPPARPVYDGVPFVPIYNMNQATSPRSPNAPEINGNKLRGKFVYVTDSENDNESIRIRKRPPVPSEQNGKKYHAKFVSVTDSEDEDKANKMRKRPPAVPHEQNFQPDPFSSFPSLRQVPTTSNGFSNRPDDGYTGDLDDDAGLSTVANAGSAVSYALPESDRRYVEPTDYDYNHPPEKPHIPLNDDPFAYLASGIPPGDFFKYQTYKRAPDPNFDNHSHFEKQDTNRFPYGQNPNFPSTYPTDNPMGASSYQGVSPEAMKQSQMPPQFNPPTPRPRDPRRGNGTGIADPGYPYNNPGVQTHHYPPPSYPSPGYPPSSPTPPPRPPHRPASRSFSKATKPGMSLKPRPLSADYTYGMPSGMFAYPPDSPMTPTPNREPPRLNGIVIGPPSPFAAVWRKDLQPKPIQDLLLSRLHKRGFRRIKEPSIRTVIGSLASCGVFEAGIRKHLTYITEYIEHIANTGDKKLSGKSACPRLILSVKEILHLCSVIHWRNERERQPRTQKMTRDRRKSNNTTSTYTLA
ncbi:hypothetical protein H072_2887 [Dactylellina haptotyla CBS 200.50]|uniref:non-specific serine/threonine protein kinase n=1 Tax=Dactylellina haptotyla (strain CBS 200.50) TaxID=1284197 RepID=S8BUE6_DACHA|nr:hypothetical protein H072_2887 [Dactylellina haptotyla CBS 200.50]